MSDMSFFYSTYDETFVIAGYNNNGGKYTILWYDYIEKKVKHVKNT